MCVICVKSKGVKFPDNDTLTAMWNTNPDGAGFMFPENGKVRIIKGLMKYSDFIKKLNETREKYGDDIPYILHFRIGTSGGNIPQNTHPFAITGDYNIMKKLDCKAKYGVAMNGIINCKIDRGVSDTMTYIKTTLSHLPKINPSWYRSKEAMELIWETTECKWAILNGTGDIRLIGQFEKSKDEGDECYYSNLHWAWRKTNGSAWRYNWNNEFGWDDDDYYGIDDDSTSCVDDDSIAPWLERYYGSKVDKSNLPSTKFDSSKASLFIHPVDIEEEREYVVIGDDFLDPLHHGKEFFGCDASSKLYKWSSACGAYVAVWDGYVLNELNINSSDRYMGVEFYKNDYSNQVYVDFECMYFYNGEKDEFELERTSSRGGKKNVSDE